MAVWVWQERDDTTFRMKRGKVICKKKGKTQWKDSVGRDTEKCWDYRGRCVRLETMGRNHL